MLISNYYYTYTVDNNTYVGGDANISSSSNYDTIFDVEIININKELKNYGLIAFYKENTIRNTDYKRVFEIFILVENINYEEHYCGFGSVNIKNA
ncbi:hypothetical protein H3C61_01275 [Candidatus Gracilibacteria bacterium]|nr:hypothetical protein [Candidatus Gracilibacteria bacterium]